MQFHGQMLTRGPQGSSMSACCPMVALEIALRLQKNVRKEYSVKLHVDDATGAAAAPASLGAAAAPRGPAPRVTVGIETVPS